MSHKGETWNESAVYKDTWTLREVRRITCRGLYNELPTYHTGTAFTADGEFLVFVSCRQGKDALFSCHVPTGDIMQLTEADGCGGVLDFHLDNGQNLGTGTGLCGTALCLAPRSRWCVYTLGHSLRAVHIETLEERLLIPDVGNEWLPGIPSIDLHERYVVVPLMPAHPEIRAGRRVTKGYMEWYADGGMRTRYVQVPLVGGDLEEVYLDEGCGCAHSPHCPSDPNLLFICRDFPPKFWAGSDGVTNRHWILNLRERTMYPLCPRDAGRFQVHGAWTYDGRAVVYHGPSVEGGWYVGVVSREGEVFREYLFREARHYGHVSADAKRPAIILDGTISPDLLVWLYYDEEQPRTEVIARHGTHWRCLPGQFTHPHPQADPTGRWISFNAAMQPGRTDIFVVKV